MAERFQRTSSTSPTNGAVLRVKRVSVEGLFGLYNHDIPLNAEERVTIVHGPNGVGKTVLLKMIAAVFDGKYGELAKVRFKKLDIELSDSSVATFESIVVAATQGQQQALKVSQSLSGQTLHEQEFSEPEQIDTTGRAVAVRTRRRRGRGRFPDLDIDIDAPQITLEPEWLAKLRSKIQIHLIETQRLLRMDIEYALLVPTVHQYASELHERITEALARYATESQSLDQSFPQRLVRMRGQTGFSASDLKARMTALNDNRARLEKIGLLDSARSSPFEVESLDALDPVQNNVMSLYVEDTQRKLEVFDDLSRRTTLLLDNINGKFRNKSIQISRENGFVVLGHDGEPIEPDSLSSGEQHELVQLYDLLFRVKPGTLVLIDEPELSLHVLWQKKYLSELLEIAKTAQFDAIVATHSPFIVGDRSDLMVPLAADIDT